jgi:hypothetical protein
MPPQNATRINAWQAPIFSKRNLQERPCASIRPLIVPGRTSPLRTRKGKFTLGKDCSWNDADVTKILEQVHANEELIFSRILVVDSEGIGAIPLLPKNRRWNQAAYRSYDHNLGSGANLRERLMIAAEAGADYACAFNHDGQVDPKVVSGLLKVVKPVENIVAAYPLSLLMTMGLYNVTGTRRPHGR